MSKSNFEYRIFLEAQLKLTDEELDDFLWAWQFGLDEIVDRYEEE